MMVGELDYENTFTADNFIQQMVFMAFVVIMTIMLNNLLIGLTTSNVHELIREVQREKTLFMLQDIIDYYGVNIGHKYKYPRNRRRAMLRKRLSVIDPQDLENDLNLETPWPKKIIIEASGPKNYEEILKDIRSPPNWRDGQSWSDSSIKEILLNVKDNLKNLYRVITSADDLYLMEVEPADADADGKS